jgi:hypothetical protein
MARPEFDYLIVANRAEAVNGLLYVMGGNFTQLTRQLMKDAVNIHNFHAAFSVSIPSDSPTQLHVVTIRVTNADESTVLSEAKASFSVTGPSDIPENLTQHAVGVVEFSVIYPTAGFYQVIATLDNESDSKRWGFQVNNVE